MTNPEGLVWTTMEDLKNSSSKRRRYEHFKLDKSG